MREEKVSRTHKARLFSMLFGREECKENALSLYNAVNETNYENAEDLIFTTIDDVVFMIMENDVFFLFGSNINLYEHQIPYDPNMPLRGLIYFEKLFSRYTDGAAFNIFNKSLVSLPVPRFIVFYNGTEKHEPVEYLRLTDSMDFPESSGVEVIAKMININRSEGQEILGRCRALREYFEFIGIIRRNLDGGMDGTTAVNAAVDECIEKKILHDVLRLHRAEVVGMSLAEYDEQRRMRNFFEDDEE